MFFWLSERNVCKNDGKKPQGKVGVNVISKCEDILPNVQTFFYQKQFLPFA
jgi:hypothetical protein